MSQSNINQQVGQAWKMHREGDNRGAVDEFNRILQSAQDNVDAYYGLGLALRADGQKEKSKEAFQKAYDLSQQALEAVRKLNDAEGSGGATEIGSTEQDRFMMLTRMLSQRLSEVGVKVN